MINEAVILLGGMGTRLLPLTKTIPKEMLPIYDAPAIFLLVEEAYLSGIKKIIFVITKYNKKIIENFFSNNDYLNIYLKDKPDKQQLLNRINNIINNMEFKYVYQTTKGTYGALYSSKKYIKNDNFIVMYGDDLFDSNKPLTKVLIENYKKKKSMYAIIKEEKIEQLPNGGVVKLDKDNNIIDLVKKDKEHSSCIILGRMLLNKKIFTVKNKVNLRKDGEYYLTYALLLFPNEVRGLKYNGSYFNLGEKTGYIKASINYAIKNKDEKNNLIKYIKEVI